MLHDQPRNIFKSGSKTYFYSSLFFPPKIRDEVSTLYAFVRTADNFVDSVPQDQAGFYAFRQKFMAAWQGNGPVGDPVIDRFLELAKKNKFQLEWVQAFLESMEMDLHKTQYKNLAELENYIFGSAEVVGLMMARILGLPEEADRCARLQGKAMQFINFLRDINEDLKLGRVYFPQDELRFNGVESLEYTWVSKNQEIFNKFTLHQIARYRQWQEQAAEGYKYIPRTYLPPIKTAAEMYNWTAEQIKRDPMEVFRKTVKPSKLRIIMTVLRHKMENCFI